MDPATIRMLALLHRYAENVTSKPGVRKYRRVKLSNSTYHSTVGGSKVGKEMLSKAGWRIKKGWLVLDKSHTTGAALASEVAAYTAAYEGAPSLDGAQPTTSAPTPAPTTASAHISSYVTATPSGGGESAAAAASLPSSSPESLKDGEKEEECKVERDAPDGLAGGCRVLIYGLEKRPELNGVEGIVKEPDKRKGRWAVSVETVSTITGERSTKLCSLKASCLAVVRCAAAEAEASLLPPPRAVQYWLEGGSPYKPSGERQHDLAQEATRWLILAVRAAHVSRLIKQAGRALMACRNFTCNLDPFRCWDEILIPELKASLVALGAKAKSINAASKLETTLTTANILATALYNLQLFPAGAATPRDTIRQDVLMPSMTAGPSSDYARDWQAQPEHIYIHMLLLVATALNPLFGAAVNDLTADMDGIELHDAPIKSFTRMLNKLMAADDHRYVEQQPRPAMNIDIVRLLASATTAENVIELVTLVAARFGGLSHLKCLPELAASNPAAADARYHMLPVMVTVVFAPEGLTVGDLLADPVVRAAWAKIRATQPSVKVSSEQWQMDHDIAVKVLETKCDPTEPVQMHCEVQVVTKAMADIRHEMHELYKVVRAADGAQLHADVAKPEVEVEDVDWNDVKEHDVFVAADKGRIATVKRLLKRSGAVVNVDWQAEDGEAAIFRAAQHNHLSVVLALLEHNADPNIASTDGGATSMHTAAQHGHIDVARMLLAHNADPNKASTDDGSTPMHMAVQNGHVDVAKLLLTHNADPNKAMITNGSTPMTIAAQYGHVGVATVLLGHSVDPNQATTDQGNTPMLMAATYGHVDVAKVLLAHNVDPNKARSTDGATPMLMAAQQDHVEVVKLLLAHNADPNKAGIDNGATPMFMAALQGHVEVVRVLLAHNADPNKATAGGSNATPLKIAAQHGHTAIVDLLKRYGVAN